MAERYSVYDRAKKNANTATAPVQVHTTINQINVGTIPELVREWHDDTKIKGFAFSLHTPQVDPTRPSGMSAQDESLFLVPEERAKVVAMLHSLKREFGGFILMSGKQIDLLDPNRQLEAYGQNCQLPTAVVSVDSKFKRKSPCVMGEGMDCGRCGCVMPTMVNRWQRGDVESIWLSNKTMLK